VTRPFSHPNFGRQVRVEQDGREVRLVFVAATERQADDMAKTLLGQLEAGGLNLTLMGHPTSIEERP
jgi:hypothetical protein